MGNQDLQTEDIHLSTSELDDIIDSGSKDVGNISDDALLSTEADISVIKEEPVLSSLDTSKDISSLEELSTIESNIDVLESDKDVPLSSIDETDKTIEKLEPSANGNEVLFTDKEEPSPLKMTPDEGDDEIVIDEETEKIVHDQIKSKEKNLDDEYQVNVEDIELASSSEPAAGESADKSFFNDGEDETISLSSDELSNILEDKAESSKENIEEVPTVDSVLGEKTEDIESAQELEEIGESVKDIELTDDTTLNDLTDTVGADVESLEELDTETLTELKEPSPGSVKPQEEDVEKSVEKDTTEIEELIADEIPISLEEDKGVPSVSDKEMKLEDVKPVEKVSTEAALSQDEKLPTGGSESAAASSFFEEDEDESVSLTGNELDSILQGAEVVEEAPSETTQEEEIPLESVQEISSEESSEEEISIEDLHTEQPGTEIPAIPLEKDIDKEQLKTVIKYLDNMLDNLPEDKIKEFAESEYYELYNKLLDSLGV